MLTPNVITNQCLCSTEQHSAIRVNKTQIWLICEIHIPDRFGSWISALRESGDWLVRTIDVVAKM